MIGLTNLDYWIIAGALVVILLVGIGAARLASRSLEHYFLGGRKLPWYILGVSGMSGWFDMTGTMIITSFLYLMGPLGLYIEFRGGAGLGLAFMLAFANKWGRRSGCMTYAEWNTYRFGTGFAAELIRFVTAAVGILMAIGLIAYLVRGATLFMGLMFPVDPVLLTLGIFAFASIYTIFAGFYGMVFADLLQGTIMIASTFVVSILAWHQVESAAALSGVALAVTGNPNWVAAAPTLQVTVPPGYEAYHDLMMAAVFYFARSTIGGFAGGERGGTHPLAFAARNPREASLLCLVQGVTVMFRWPLMISFAILGIYMVSRTVPDASALFRAAQAIHAAEPSQTANEWHQYTTHLVRHPEQSPPELVKTLANILGPHWQNDVLLVSSRGTVDPELIVPAVILSDFKPGLRGLMVAALLSALMGCLSSMVNSTSALFVRDIYQNFLRTRAKNWELILAAYISSIAVVAISFVIGLHASNINELWGWLIMSLIAGAMGPTVLRLYWWRINAWGMVAGFIVGVLGAFAQRIFWPTMSEWWQFPLMTTLSFVATIIGSLLTEPVATEIVKNFYETTRPFGWWRPFFAKLPKQTQIAWRREHRNDLITVAIALLWQVCLLLLPMEILTHNKTALFMTLPIFITTCAGLYFFWWRNLPSADEKIPDFASRPPVHSIDELKSAEKIYS